MEEIRRFIKRRDAVLRKRSVEALEEFVMTDPAYEGDPVREEFPKASPAVKEMALCKMILASFDSPLADVEWALRRLEELRRESRRESYD